VSSCELPVAPRDFRDRTAGCLRVMLLGDVVGKPGLRIACSSVKWLRRVLQVDGLIVNAENAADGSGLRVKDYRRLIDAGFDAITLGDHVYRKREIIETLETQPNIVRPCNLPANAPGKKSTVIMVGDGHRLAVISAMGRVFMKPVDCPFHAVARELESLDESIRMRVVDFHAEATSDMQVMGRYLDGRVSAVLGTHTHVATADEKILPRGTGFQCDIGMTGPFESILGRNIEAVLESTLDGVPVPFQVATGDVRLNGTWCDLEIITGKCKAIGRIEFGEQAINQYNASMCLQRNVL
jgi:2',3'-cyclic-nucleotide 2'-phosphodiesterase